MCRLVRTMQIIGESILVMMEEGGIPRSIDQRGNCHTHLTNSLSQNTCSRVSLRPVPVPSLEK